jgi:hypothetical protein
MYKKLLPKKLPARKNRQQKKSTTKATFCYISRYFDDPTCAATENFAFHPKSRLPHDLNY